VKAGIQNIKGYNLATVKLATVQGICKADMVSFTKRAVAEHLCTVQGICFNNMHLYSTNTGQRQAIPSSGITLRKDYDRVVSVAKQIVYGRKPQGAWRQEAIPSSGSKLRKDYDRVVSVAKQIVSGRMPQGAWRQEELIGGPQPVS
jgi:hypothetical protein